MKEKLLKTTSLMLAFLFLVFCFVPPKVEAKGDLDNLEYVTDDTLEYVTDDTFKVNIDNVLHIYTVINTFSKTVVVEKVNNIVVEKYTFDKIANSITTEISDIVLDNVYGNIIEPKNVLNKQDTINGLNSNHPPRYSTVNLSISQLCTAVGVSISVANFIGLLVALAGGAVTISVYVIDLILSEAVSLSLTIGGLVTNRGIRIRIKETYGKRCRGSDCHEGYFFRDYLSYSLY